MLLATLLPAQAERRVALLIEQLGAPGSSAPAGTAALAEVLRSRFGFDVVVARHPDERQAREHVAAFRQLLSESEFALLFVAARLDHNGSGTYIALPAGSADKLQTGLPLDDLFSDMVGRSRSSLVLLEALEDGGARPGFVPGPGRMPQLEDRLLIAHVTGATPVPRSGELPLVDALGGAVDARAIRPASIVRSLRDQVYLRSAGLRIMRTIGSLPANVTLDATAIERGELIAAIRQRMRDICSSDYRDNRVRTEQRVLSHYSGPLASLRQASLTDNNTFGLERLLEEMKRSSACPYLPPPPPPVEAKASPVAPAVPDAKKPEPSQPLAALPPASPPPGQSAEPPAEKKRIPAPSESKDAPSKKAPEVTKQRKAQADDDDDEPPAPKAKRSPSPSSSSGARPAQPASEGRSAPRPAAPSPQPRGPINVPTF